MKLEQAVETGRFCGLETVEEAMRNIYYHSSMFSDKEFPQMWRSLEDEYALWKKGDLVLDFDAIDARVAEQYKQMEAEMMASPPCVASEIDF